MVEGYPSVAAYGEAKPTLAEPVADPPPVLSVVIPSHNESENILRLLAEIREALDARVSYEVVVVDDCSDDATSTLLRQAAASFPTLRAFRHHRQCGQSTALVTGVRNSRAPWIATLDGDGQNDPADIPKLLAVLRDSHRGSGLGLIAGHRAKRKDTWLKRLSSRIANGIRSRLLHDQTPDTGCGLKLFERDAFLALPHFDHVHRFLPALFQRAGLKVVSVPVNHRPRTRGQSHYGVGNRLWVGIVDMLGVMWLQRRSRLPQGIEDLSERN